MKMSEFLKGHVLIEDTDVAEGIKRHCSCGWEESDGDSGEDKSYQFDDHIDAEAERAGIGHVPTVVNEWVDKMVENRRGWCRDMRTREAEDHQMNRVFKEFYANAEIMANPDENSGDIHYKWMVKKGPLL